MMSSAIERASPRGRPIATRLLLPHVQIHWNVTSPFKCSVWSDRFHHGDAINDKF